MIQMCVGEKYRVEYEIGRVGGRFSASDFFPP